MTRTSRLLILAAGVCAGAAALSAQQARYDDVVRNLRNPDAKTRLSAVRLLRDSKYPEAVGPMAALVTDPLDEIQLEAIAAELSFFLVDDVRTRKRVALLVEVRNPGIAPAAYELGPLAVWPRPVPPELIKGLLQAVDDDNPKVRLEAIYALGTIARAPVAAEPAAQLVKALDHYDPAIRTAAARVIGRLEVRSAGDALITAMNDSQAPVRTAAMRALGAIREPRAIQALTERFNHYGKGEEAWAALDALARIGDPSSVPLFKGRLADRDAFMRRAAAEGLARSGDTTELAALEVGAGNDTSDMVRAAMVFALQKLGKSYIPRLVEFLGSAKMAPQAAEYVAELGPSVTPLLLPSLQDPSPAIRANVALVLGALGGQNTAAALQPLTQDPDRDVAQAATRAIERIKMQ
ncbi:MAG: HEAT repeat domain-containing protein [Acidobacteriota bacterium]